MKRRTLAVLEVVCRRHFSVHLTAVQDRRQGYASECRYVHQRSQSYDRQNQAY